MFTTAARASAQLREDLGPVLAVRDLESAGVGADRRRAQFAAGRWQRSGKAVILHSGTLNRDEQLSAALVSCGPRAILTSFTAVQESGLRGWERAEIHVLAPAGTRNPDIPGLILHRTGDWSRRDQAHGRPLQRLEPALVVAASSFRSSRPGCGLLAAAVQQRLTTPEALRRALLTASRTRHRRQLLLAVGDVEQGAQALSEIDLGRICLRAGLPRPTRQAVRIEPSGRRRYLDAEWRLPDGRVVGLEVDGAHHLSPQQWTDDQLRQNSIVLGGTVVLRYPSVVLRDQPELVAAQLRRALCGS